MNWYISQRIVAVNDHPQNDYKKGDEFVIQGLRNSECKCVEIDIDIGIPGGEYGWECDSCGFSSDDPQTIAWYGEKNFAPLDEIEAQISELVEEAFVKEPFE